MKEYEEKYWSLIAKQLSNTITSEESDELTTWLQGDPERLKFFTAVQKIWETTASYQTPSFHVENAWQKIQTDLKFDQEEIISPVKKLYWPIWAAAIVAVVILFSWFFWIKNLNQIELITLADEQKEVELPDGSIIFLNENSTLTYSKNLNEQKQREVVLEGEAFFEVTKNPKKPFIVSSGNTLVQVLGTSFNIQSKSSGEVTVAVVTGKVSFQPANQPQREVLLLAHDEGKYADGKIIKQRYENPNFLFWKNKQLNYTNATLEEILTDLEKNYQVEFTVADKKILSRRITTSFKGDSLEKIITVLEVLLQAKIQNSKNNVYTIN